MNVYAIIPIFAIVAYIPLFLTTAASRPWQKRHTLFILFLSAAMSWSLIDYFFRSNFFPQYNIYLLKAILVVFPLMVVQLHCLTSSFFPIGRNRWLPFAYISLGIIIILIQQGYIVEDVQTIDGRIYPSYGLGIIPLAVMLLVLAGRNLHVLWKRLKLLDDPVMYNQLFTLILGIIVLIIFIPTAILPWGREFPIPHIGNLIVAVILSYSVVRHHLLDIKLVLREGTAWVTLGIIGVVTYWLILVLFHQIFNFEISLTTSFAATGTGFIVAAFIYRLRRYLFELMSRAFHGPSYDYRQKLSNFSSSIHNIFSLREQGGELLTLITKAISIKHACLLFPEKNNEIFAVQFIEPDNQQNRLSDFELKTSNPVIKYLEREKRPLFRESISILPIFLGLRTLEKEEVESRGIEILMPLISRDRLIAILVLGKKASGRYTLEDLAVLEEVTSLVAVSIEKEYLREQLREHEEELSVINRFSAIITSSMDIQEIFGSFIEELKRVVDVGWASIALAEKDELCCVAQSPSLEASYQVGERIPSEGTGSGWVIRNKRSFLEPDISKENRFTTGDNFNRQGLRTVVYLPLISKDEAIGSLVIASKLPNAYSQRHIKLLEQLASQIAMPLENAQLYARTEAKARTDELTGLLNRRALDEMIDSEISRHSRYGGVFSLAILDLDSLKSYNDTYGHLEGDMLLKQVGHIIRNTIRAADYAFRYGGDEFAILLPQTSIDDTLQVTERVREKISSETDSRDMKITASIGLASWPDDGVSHTDIIAAADVTLYRAKRSGGNKSFYSTGSLSPLQLIKTNEAAETNIDKKTLSIIHALAEAVDSNSYLNCDDSKRVAQYAIELGKFLKLKPPEINQLEISALLHDIGKVSIGNEILNKPGRLTPEEWEIMRTHPKLGAAIAEKIPKLSRCVAGIYHHHEKYDGTGYPDGLKGENIPLQARILAVADAFAAMTSERPYAPKLTQEEALKEIERGAGKQFDPYLAETFLHMHTKNLTVTEKSRR
jgi:diguanylate cyclase (GGDEF)-like protein